MANLLERVTALERKQRSFESSVAQNLELLAASAEGQSTSRGQFRGERPNNALCWDCAHAGVVEVEKDGERGYKATCRILRSMQDGLWLDPFHGRSSGTIVECVHVRPVADGEGPGAA